jgi:hypothetical protein
MMHLPCARHYQSVYSSNVFLTVKLTDIPQWDAQDALKVMFLNDRAE